MRPLSILLAVMLAFSTVTTTALASDDLDKMPQLKRGMTDNEVLSVMGREPEVKTSTKTDNGTAVMVYAWWDGKDYLRTLFVGERLAAFGPVFMDHSFPPPTKQ